MRAPTLNLAPQSTSCPPGYHWEAPGPIMGIRACVPNPAPTARKVIPLTLAPAAPAPAPAPTPKKVIPLTLSVKASPPPTAPAVPTTSTEDAAPAPVEDTAPVECPPCWPWWWLLIAGAAGFGVTYALSGKDKKAKERRKNAGAYAMRAAARRLNPAAMIDAVLG